MKIRSFIKPGFACVILFFAACNSNEKKIPETNSSSANINSAPLPVLDFFNEQCPLPFTADTNLLFHLENFDSLGTKEVKTLAANWFKHDLVGGCIYDLETFYKIDSVKAIGKYNEYCDSLQIGNTKSSNAYSVCKLNPDSHTVILVWMLVTQSYEACPYSETKTVYFTIVYKGMITQTFELGEYGTFADAPVSMQRTVSGKMNKDLTFAMDVYQEGDEDMDLPTIEVTREHYEFAINDGKISLVKEDKKAPEKVKRKVENK